MGIKVSWLVEGRVISWKAAGVITTSDVKAADASTITLFRASDAPLVHTIFDYHAIEKLPHVADFVRLNPQFPQHPQNGWNIFVALKKPLHKMTITIAATVFRASMRQVATCNEALQFLQSVDSTLPDLADYTDTSISA